MKKVLPAFIFILFISLSVRAQITVTSADMPSSGDTIRVSLLSNFTGITPAVTGTNFTWDYSTLVASSQTVDTFASTLSTGLYLAYFPTASFAMKSNTAPVSLGTITVDYQYDFFKKNTGSYVMMGMGASVSGLPVGAVNNPGDTLYRFPLNYNDIAATASSFAVNIPSIGFYGGNRTRVDTVDGWGTLITPYGTHNVLRVKSTVIEIDSIYISSFGIGFNTPPIERTEYKWIANGKKIPLLQINTSGGTVTDVIYRDSLRTSPVGIHEIQSADASISLYPNPSENLLSVRNKTNTPIASLEIYDAVGKKQVEKQVRSNPSVENMDISALPGGLYFVRIYTAGSYKTLRFIKR